MSMSEKIIAYKAMDKNMQCRGKQYEVGAASGDCSTGAASGWCSSAEVSGKDSIAVANGANSKARGALGCYIVLTEYDDDGKLLRAKMAQVDGDVIKEMVWYTLKNGEFTEVEP